MAWFIAGHTIYPERLDVIGWDPTDGQTINTEFAGDL